MIDGDASGSVAYKIFPRLDISGKRYPNHEYWGSYYIEELGYAVSNEFSPLSLNIGLEM